MLVLEGLLELKSWLIFLLRPRLDMPRITPVELEQDLVS